MTDLRVEFSCKDCGYAIVIFVAEAAERNGKVTCPACGRLRQYSLADIRELFFA